MFHRILGCLRCLVWLNRTLGLYGAPSFRGTMSCIISPANEFHYSSCLCRRSWRYKHGDDVLWSSFYVYIVLGDPRHEDDVFIISSAAQTSFWVLMIFRHSISCPSSSSSHLIIFWYHVYVYISGRPETWRWCIYYFVCCMNVLLFVNVLWAVMSFYFSPDNVLISSLCLYSGDSRHEDDVFIISSVAWMSF